MSAVYVCEIVHVQALEVFFRGSKLRFADFGVVAHIGDREGKRRYDWVSDAVGLTS